MDYIIKDLNSSRFSRQKLGAQPCRKGQNEIISSSSTFPLNPSIIHYNVNFVITLLHYLHNWEHDHLAQAVQLEGSLSETKGGMFLTLTSMGNMRYSMLSSLKILIISSTRVDLLTHLSPMSWWFILCDTHSENFSRFKSSTSLITIIGAGYQ